MVEATDSASRPRRLDELGLNEENPKSGTWSLFKRLILFPRVPLVPLYPRTSTLAAISVFELDLALKRAL